MKERDKRSIDDLLNRFERSERAVPDDDFVQKMETMAEAFVRRGGNISRSTLFGIAASLALLVAVNIWMLQSTSSVSTPYVESSSENYSLIPAKSVYYE